MITERGATWRAPRARPHAGGRHDDWKTIWGCRDRRLVCAACGGGGGAGARGVGPGGGAGGGVVAVPAREGVSVRDRALGTCYTLFLLQPQSVAPVTPPIDARTVVA